MHLWDEPEDYLMAFRKGTTLVELLVVAGLIALLIAILLPVLRSARNVAHNTVCTSRLRDLAVAAQMYRQDFGRYPEPCRYDPPPGATAKAKILPHQVQRRLLNDMRSYLKYPLIEPATPAARLPHHVQSPAAEKVPNGRGPKKNHVAEPEHYYTGFNYFGRLDEASVIAGAGMEVSQDTPLLLKPDRPAVASGSERRVIWADDLHHSVAEGGLWRFVHSRGGGNGGQPFTYHDVNLLQGQHRAYTDGSVEWMSARELSVQAPDTDRPNGDASYRVDQVYWWF
jgi:type II secretory pathway pseudopilin PulG